MSMTSLQFFKYSATGNDFLVLDLRKNKFFAEVPRHQWVKQICHRRFGIGADGVVVLESDAKVDFAWDFYNSDGSQAEMCGNAARCVALHMQQIENLKELTFRTRAGLIETKFFSEDNIQVKMSLPSNERWNQIENLSAQQVRYDYVIAGVPHAIVRVPTFKDVASLKDLARILKAQPIFGPQSTNVTFIRERSNQNIQIVTFERGVENLTLSCGTGAVAAAYSLLRGENDKEIYVQVPGGKLKVVFKKNVPYLIGPAQFVAELKLNQRYFSKEKR